MSRLPFVFIEVSSSPSSRSFFSYLYHSKSPVLAKLVAQLEFRARIQEYNEDVIVPLARRPTLLLLYTDARKNVLSTSSQPLWAPTW